MKTIHFTMLMASAVCAPLDQSFCKNSFLYVVYISLHILYKVENFFYGNLIQFSNKQHKNSGI